MRLSAVKVMTGGEGWEGTPLGARKGFTGQWWEKIKHLRTTRDIPSVQLQKKKGKLASKEKRANFVDAEESANQPRAAR